MSEQPTLFDPRIADWLEDGPDKAPSIVLDSVVAALPSIPQRHSWRQLRRYSQMPRFAVAAVATVVLVAAAAALFIPRSTGPGLAPSATPAPSSVASNAPSSAPTAAPSATAGERTLSRGELGRVLPADTYRVNGFAVPLSITLPDGWRPQEFTENNIFVANTTDNGLLNVSLLVLDKVYADPCTAAGGPHPIGSGVDALVTALSNMAGFEVDDLRDVSVGGAAGKAFTLTNSVDAESCVGGDPWLWIGTYEKDGSDELVRTIRGAVDPFWIVDVAGTTVLIAPGIRDTSASSLAAADSMVDAISFPDATPVAPSFAPDATRIAFVSDCEVAGEIYTMNADGSNMVNITNSSFPDSNPTWSPDRTRIAFASIRDNNSDIYSMNADGSDVLRLTDGPAEEGGPAWSPDGASIAFERNGGIYTMNADGSEAVRLSDDGFSPAWSPDGTRIAFMRRGAKLDDIYSMNADGSGVVRLTNVDGWQFSPAWSPDGSKLAFSSGLGIGTHEIHTMNADGSNVVRLTNRAPAVGPAWSPDGARIAFSRSDGIYSMNADGSDLIRLTNNMGCVEAAAW